jgi:FkbM family methyltransferase
MQINAHTLPLAMTLRAAARLLPLRGWQRIFRAVFPPERQKSYAFTTPYFEYCWHGDAGNLLDWIVLFEGTYESADTAFVRDLLRARTEPVVLDIGANAGHYTLATAALAGHVHAFEPYAPVRDRLCAHLADNGIGNVTVHSFGLSNVDGVFAYAPPESFNRGAGRFAANGALSLALRTGDDVLREHGIARVDLIKIDTEGHEMAVLEGLHGTIARCRPVLLVEVWSPVEELSRRLPAGYRFFAHRRAKLLDAYRLSPVRHGRVQGNVICLPPASAPA